MKTVVAVLLIVLEIVLSGCQQTAKSTAKPPVTMTETEYAAYKSLREKTEQIQFEGQKTQMEINNLISRICQDRAIDVQQCAIDPGTRIVKRQIPPAAPPQSAAHPQ